MTQYKPESAGWRAGRRVSRKDSAERGTVVEVNPEIKVKWDGGRTSYFRRDKPANVKLDEPKPG